ncbi:MAG: hypothetical protein QGH15_21955 [Kiritimatiellia bacterium]|nr:hypothetical protein [Kiritimatiellia bacterium]
MKKILPFKSLVLVVICVGCQATQNNTTSTDLRAFRPIEQKLVANVGEEVPISLVIANTSKEHQLFVYDWTKFTIRKKLDNEVIGMNYFKPPLGCGTHFYALLHENTLDEAGCKVFDRLQDGSTVLLHGCRSSYTLTTKMTFSKPGTVIVKIESNTGYYRIGSGDWHGQELDLEYEIEILPKKQQTKD